MTRLTSDEEKQIEMKRRIGKGGWGRELEWSHGRETGSTKKYLIVYVCAHLLDDVAWPQHASG